MIRVATDADYDVLTDMGERFYRESAMCGLVPFHKQAAADFVRTVAQSPDGCFFVGEIAGELIGMIGGMLSPHWFAPSHWKVAQELFWYVDKDHRKGTTGVKLLAAFEGWAKERNALGISMMGGIVTDSPASSIFQRMGYAPVEQQFFKEL